MATRQDERIAAGNNLLDEYGESPVLLIAYDECPPKRLVMPLEYGEFGQLTVPLEGRTGDEVFSVRDFVEHVSRFLDRNRGGLRRWDIVRANRIRRDTSILTQSLDDFRRHLLGM